MKKYFLLSVMAIVATAQALACGGYWARPNYYVFHVYHDNSREDGSSPYTEQVNKYWIDYTGGKADAYSVYSLAYVDLNKWAQSDNEIVRAIIDKKDYEAELYVKRLIAYLKLCNESFNSWDYPDEAQLAERDRNINGLRAQAMGYNGDRFKSQYALLVMRTFMLQKRHTDNISYWNNTASHMPQNVYRDMMRDIYAGALHNTGHDVEARAIFAELGDVESLHWMLRKKRNLAGIKELYGQDPNSPLMLYLVEDFVHNAQETLDYDDTPEDRESIEYVGRRAIYRNEVNDFIKYATKLGGDKSVNNRSMWLAAAGVLNHFMGNDKNAVAQLEQAMTASGTPFMRDNARACLAFVKCESSIYDATFDKYLAGELKWLQSKTKEDEYFTKILSRIGDSKVAKQLPPNTAIALMGWLGSNDVTDWGSDYSEKLEHMTANEYKAFNDYISSKKHSSALDSYITSSLHFETVDYNDVIGTKLLREGRFDEAIPYLEKVPLSYLSKQGISRYAARRDYTKERWMGRQIVDYEDDYAHWYETSTLTTNQKVDFCRDILRLKQQLKTESGEQRYRTAYNLAAMLFQASYKGDCWYLTHYSSSISDEQEPNEMDFIQAAADYLQIAVKSSDTDLHQRSLYALAYLPITPCYEIDWEDNFILKDNYGFNYYALSDLAAYRSEHAGNLPRYISHCDILTKFMDAMR